MVDETTVPRFGETEDLWPDTVPMLQNGWRPTGGEVNPEADEGLVNWPLRELVRRTRWLRRRVDNLALKVDSETTVGPGGQYPTINAALIVLSERRPAYRPAGFLARIRLLAGYTMAEQVLVSGANLSWLQIVSDAPEVLIDRAALVQQFGSCYPAFAAANGGSLPQIRALFAMTSAGDATLRTGVYAVTTGSATIASGFGVKNCGQDAIRAETAGQISANGAILTNAGGCGIFAAGGTRITAVEADCSNAGDSAVYGTGGAIIQAESAILTGANVRGVYAVRGATINATLANARRNGATGADTTADFVVAQGGTIIAPGGIGGTSVAVNALTAAGMILR
jgi:hypothetical protein